MSGPVAWSTFPPSSHRREQAAKKIQHVWRGKTKAMSFAAMRAATRVMQRWLRVALPARRAAKANAATAIQSLWRGAMSRRVYALALEYNVSPEALAKAAATIQRCVRRTRARLAALALADRMREERKRLNGCAARIQRAWRRFTDPTSEVEETEELLGLQRHMANFRTEYRAATTIQLAWHAFERRERLWRERVRVQAGIQLQALVRGWLVRKELDAAFDFDDAEYLRAVAERLVGAHGIMRHYVPTSIRGQRYRGNIRALYDELDRMSMTGVQVDVG